MDIYKKYNPNADREFYYYSMLNSGRCFEKLGEFKSAKLLYKDIKKNTKDKYFIIAGERLRLLKQKIRYLHEAKLIK